jgi:aldose 1-epimerase
MERPRLYVLSNDAWEVGLLPETGMSTAFGRIQRGDGFIDFMRPTPVDAYAVAPDCANYLLIPWSNRIRDARFVFRGVTHQLRVNFPDGTAMHGTAKDFPWEVLAVHPTHLAASFDSRHHSVNFPFPFVARAEFSLEGGAFIQRLSLTNVGAVPMPGGFGHHP